MRFILCRLARTLAATYVHFQKRAVATEARAERGHPPQAVRHGIFQRAFEDEINGRAADVAELAQDGGAVAHVGFGQFQFVAQWQESRRVRQCAKSSR